MAKRKRLTPAQQSYLSPVGLETKALAGPFGAPPIAQVAGEAAAASALDKLAGELHAARAEGRLVQAIPLAAIEAEHLVRDRVEVAPAELAALRASIRARGQQTPIEVVELGEGRYGLISGWRRLQAIQGLYAETSEARFATIEALLRRPADAAEAYLAMVEENEIRVNLSYYERARIAAKAAEQGVYPTAQLAVRGLFTSASRAKRSKIGSFLALHEELATVLRYPTAISERQGLALAKLLSSQPGQGARLRERLRKAAAKNAKEEQAVLTRALAPKLPEPTGQGASPAPAKPVATLDRPTGAEEPTRGVYLQSSGGFLRPQYTLSGPRVDKAFRGRLIAWLQGQG